MVGWVSKPAAVHVLTLSSTRICSCCRPRGARGCSRPWFAGARAVVAPCARGRHQAAGGAQARFILELSLRPCLTGIVSFPSIRGRQASGDLRASRSHHGCRLVEQADGPESRATRMLPAERRLFRCSCCAILFRHSSLPPSTPRPRVRRKP